MLPYKHENWRYKEVQLSKGYTYSYEVYPVATDGVALRNLWDVEHGVEGLCTEKCQHNLPQSLCGFYSRFAMLCRNNYELITGGWDNTVQFWDLRQPYAVRKITGVHMAGEGIDISVSGKEILTAAFQKANQLALWDYGSGRCISVLEPDVYNSKLYCGKFVTKDFVVTGGTDPNLVRIVDLQTTGTAAAMNFLPGAVYSFDAGQVRKKDVPSTINKDIISTRAKSDASSIPRIGFVSSRRLYQIELY
ncbi:unnamed protein product [Acanthoscelides obtectus]|uniref:Uncharacterized protein n=1 Tax=Acanthoscelides obtectus TaxID=200917 RepID=A0A9P0NYI0_ACAOB|nr:unnamed protein product [Acanthoscelides obtectus]CAK1669604.1 F-box/WD repeat-containing protein 7 [Acanthoscelides obtectus]